MTGGSEHYAAASKLHKQLCVGRHALWRRSGVACLPDDPRSGLSSLVDMMPNLKGHRYSYPLRKLRPAFRRTGILRYVLSIVLVFVLLETHRVHDDLSHAIEQHETYTAPRGPVRIFIASLHWNNEIILREFWNQRLLELVKALGPDNVFVSVVESGSYDLSKDALRELDDSLGALGAPRHFSMDDRTHADEIAFPPTVPGNGWVKTARGDLGLRRIPYLAGLRNKSLQPLVDLASAGTTFDYVLFLGDVYFTTSDVLDLLYTNNGTYAAACSLDFTDPPLFYDTFALRDSEGFGHATQTWPYFRSLESRAAMKESRPVPVTSCWNGIVSMPATTFIGNNAIAFRGVNDSMAEMHLEGSECCLIHADNPASTKKGVFLNPHVRVGYNSEAYHSVHPEGCWVSRWGVFTGLWKNRLARWLGDPFRSLWIVHKRRLAWERQHPGDHEPGKACLVNEMQILHEYGWQHTLSAILTLLSIRELLTCSAVNTRFYSVISRLLHRRLVDIASLPDYELILECYHPSAKISTPSLSCRYLATKTWDGLKIDDESPKTGDLRNIYSSFQPIVKQENRPRRVRPWGTVSPSQPAPEAIAGPEFEIATEDVYLDDGEPFSQLCATTSVVRQRPTHGLFLSHVNISDGVIRVFRKWLGHMLDLANIGDNPERNLCDDEDILWVDTAHTVGLRFRVMPGPAERMPLITGPHDEPPMSYTLIYEAAELLVRTYHLLLAVERSTSEEVTHSGKAVVIAGL
ncbi:hypothetical protein HJFPF1_06259 [Paramyrothecium foliicola]|nr:hypothetical protein HJFPF1_06259 [Paramyrothecium foliicola]